MTKQAKSPCSGSAVHAPWEWENIQCVSVQRRPLGHDGADSPDLRSCADRRDATSALDSTEVININQQPASHRQRPLARFRRGLFVYFISLIIGLVGCFAVPVLSSCTMVASKQSQAGTNQPPYAIPPEQSAIDSQIAAERPLSWMPPSDSSIIVAAQSTAQPEAVFQSIDTNSDIFERPNTEAMEALRETPKLAASVNSARESDSKVEMAQSVAKPPNKCLPYRLDFGQLIDARLPKNWKTQGDIAIDWQAGVPALTVRSMSKTAASLEIPINAFAGDFFYEVQLAASAHSLTELAWQSESGANCFPLTLTATQNSGWQVDLFDKHVNHLRYLRYSLKRGTWFYFENVQSGDHPGLYVQIDGVPSTRTRVGAAGDGIYDSMKVSFSANNTSRIQNLRWGPILSQRSGEEGFELTSDGTDVVRIKLRPMMGAASSDSIRWSSTLPFQSNASSLQVPLTVDRSALATAVIHLVGAGNCPSMSFTFEFGRANVLNAPSPGTVDMQSGRQLTYEKGLQQIRFSVESERLSVALNGRLLYEVPLTLPLHLQSVEVDTIGNITIAEK